jgi:glucose dehydrogenase
MPAAVSAKVCIDTSGSVSDVTMMTKLERMTALDLARGIRTWTYAPYKENGLAVAACFVVSFKVK